MWCERRAAALAVVLVGAVVALASPAGAAADARIALLRMDPAESRIDFRLPGGLHDTHGSFAVKHGAMKVDSTSGRADGVVVVDAASGNSGNASRDSRMRDAVLEAGKYPEIRFRPLKLDGSLGDDGSFRALVHGTFTLHGADHELAIPIEGRVVGERWTASGRFSVPYVAWGLADPSVLFLTVAKEVEVDVQAAGDVRWTNVSGKEGDSL